MSRGNGTRPPVVPVLVVDDTATCVATAHVWPTDFAWGDTCQCGLYYLLRNEKGELRVEPRRS